MVSAPGRARADPGPEMITSCSSLTASDPSRWVGDPVDVITGTQFDVALDFRIAWSFPFEWRRFYSTARLAERLPLGWGHTHSYDHRLTFDVDGMLYVDPSGVKHGFVLTHANGIASVSGAGMLRSIGPQTFRVKVKGYPECEFHFADMDRPAQLKRLFVGRDFHQLRHAPAGRWVELIYDNQPPVRIESDAEGRIHKLVWPDSSASGGRILWEGQYDKSGNLISVLDAYGTRQSFAYDLDNRMIRRTDRRGYRFHFSFDSAGRCSRSAGEDGTQEVQTRYSDGVTVVTRGDGGEWQYFHQDGRISQIIDPYGGIIRRIYRPDGSLEREVGPSGEILQEMVDEESELLKPPFGPPVGACLPFGDPWFQPVRDLDLPADALDWEGYGAAQCRNVIRFPSKESSWAQNVPMEVVQAIRFREDPELIEAPIEIGLGGKKAMGVPERPGLMQYDPFGRLVSHTLPTGHTCRWQYDPNGNVIRYVDYAGSEWRYDYASWNLGVEEHDPLGNITRHKFNAMEKPVRIEDSGSTSTEHDFDLKDRMTARYRHSELRDLFGYDRSSGLLSAAAGNGNVRFTLKLGPHRRPVELAPNGQPPSLCEYDEEGRLIGVTGNNCGPQTFAYNRVGDRTADLLEGRGVERNYTAYNLAEIAVLERFVTRYIHNPKTGQISIVDPLGGRHVVRQLDSGVFRRHHANEVEELSQFDWNGRCLVKVRFQRKGLLNTWSRAYSYSPVGALLAINDSRRGTTTYQYDPAHRLVSAILPDGTRDTFTYDGAGNLLSGPGLEGVSHVQNRLLTANGHHFEYNDRHHIVRESAGEIERQYHYDTLDRLVSCCIGPREITFRYDALGRRIEKTSPEGVTTFVWDGERLAAEISPAGSLRVYVYADGAALTPFLFVDYRNIDAAPESGRRRYVFSDQIGCPICVESDAGEVKWRADVAAYGRTRIAANNRVELNLRWPGHYFDPETGLHYNRHRYYSPTLGRYIQVDPQDIEGGLNVYAYAARPLDSVDVDGFAPCPKKPMIRPDQADKKFQKAKQKADKISEDLRKAIAASKMHPLDKAALTLTTMVVVGKNGKYQVVVTGNRSSRVLPRSVKEAMGGGRYVGYGDDRPPAVRQDDKSFRYGRENPRSGDREDTTHNHAEQRGLRATDCDPDTKGVAYIAPTRPCCEGCSNAIQTSSNKGGWGGDDSNVSDRGKQGPHF